MAYKGITDNKNLNIPIPDDIISFLKENKYDNDLLYDVVYNTYNIYYNFAEIFKLTLKIGKGFRIKSIAMNINDEQKSISALQYTVKQYTPRSPIALMNAFDNMGDISEIIDITKNLNIHTLTMLYRMLYNNMCNDEAIKLGVTDKDKYNITFNTCRETSIAGIRQVFIQVAREYMKSKEQ